MRDKEDTLLIAFLGAQKIDNGKETKSYTKTTYAIPGEEPVESIFSFESIIATKGVSKLVLVGTKGSCWYDVCNEFMTDKDENADYLEQLKRDIMEKKEPNLLGIEGAIRSKYPDIIEVKPIIIENGKEESELEDTFVKLTQLRPLMDNGVSRIIIDITNGFRSIPIHTFLFTKYMDKLINSNISYEIYYGMFEAKERDITPTVNLKLFNELINWIMAANEFRATGNVNSLLMLLEDGEFKRPFEQFKYATETNTLHNFYESIESIKTINDGEKLEKADMHQGVKEVLKSVAEDFKILFPESLLAEEQYKLASFQLDLANWYFKQGRLGLSAVTAAEVLKTFIAYMSRRGNVFSKNQREKAREVVKALRSSNENHDFEKIILCEKELKDIRNAYAHCNYSKEPPMNMDEVNRILTNMLSELEVMRDGLLNWDEASAREFNEKVKKIKKEDSYARGKESNYYSDL